MSCLGYLAFPPPGSSVPLRAEVLASSHQPPSDVNPTAEPSSRAEHAREEKRRLQDIQRQRRVEAQAEMALQGEMEYVRMGLSIRDRHGRIDQARTDYIRAEIRRLDAQARLIKQWETYESRWKALLAADTPLAFADIPWPVPQRPSSVHDLQPEAVVQFFLDSLQGTGNATAESDRLRGALLRWHPDKMSAVLSRTVATDTHNVHEGVNIVFRALHARIHHVKDNAAAP